MASSKTSSFFREPEFLNVKLAEAASIPFLSNELMHGSPDCSAEAFKQPQLRKCPFNLDNIDWTRSRPITGGLDGFVWKIRFSGNRRAYALKIFFDPKPPLDYYGNIRHYAFQRECQNAASLQMIATAIEEAKEGITPPILIHPYPETKDIAQRNLFSFSLEGRQAGLSRWTDAKPMPVTSLPRMRECFGWVKVNGNSILGSWPKYVLPWPIKVGKVKREFEYNTEYSAIVYEWIDGKDNDPATVENVDAFLWRAGFSFQGGSHEDNWKSSVLIDLGDIVFAYGYAWDKNAFRARNAAEILPKQGR
ncbi:hypothetical protein F4814DRAFT_197595 [Daldinia grandis]|nr:hypothetical protein F4814DRAFT_197595 [Daldinia grandis]